MQFTVPARALANLPFRFPGFATAPTRVAPLLGHHNAGIGRELGLTDTAIAGMHHGNVLYAEDAAR